MNWKLEAVEKLSRYEAMVRSLENIPAEIRRLEYAARSLKSIPTDGVRAGTTGQRRDDAMINNLVQREELKNAYENARLWVDTADRALGALEPAEKNVLLKMYVQPQPGALETLCQELGMEKSSVYRKRDSALYRFTVALYGTAM